MALLSNWKPILGERRCPDSGKQCKWVPKEPEFIELLKIIQGQYFVNGRHWIFGCRKYWKQAFDSRTLRAKQFSNACQAHAGNGKVIAIFHPRWMAALCIRRRLSAGLLNIEHEIEVKWLMMWNTHIMHCSHVTRYTHVPGFSENVISSSDRRTKITKKML